MRKNSRQPVSIVYELKPKKAAPRMTQGEAALANTLSEAAQNNSALGMATAAPWIACCPDTPCDADENRPRPVEWSGDPYDISAARHFIRHNR